MQEALRHASRGPDPTFVLDMNNLEFIKTPYPTFRYLREQAPIYDWRERAAVVFSRYDDVRAVLSERDLSPDLDCWEPAPPKDQAPKIAAYYRVPQSRLIELPVLDHPRVRRMVVGAFLPRNVGSTAGMVRSVIDRFFDCHQSDKVINFRSLADLLPLQAVFPAPETLDIQRDLSRNVVYGYGLRHCMGAGLARLVLAQFIGTTLRRYPKLQLAGELAFEAHPILRLIAELPILLNAA